MKASIDDRLSSGADGFADEFTGTSSTRLFLLADEGVGGFWGVFVAGTEPPDGLDFLLFCEEEGVSVATPTSGTSLFPVTPPVLSLILSHAGDGVMAHAARRSALSGDSGFCLFNFELVGGEIIDLETVGGVADGSVRPGVDDDDVDACWKGFD